MKPLFFITAVLISCLASAQVKLYPIEVKGKLGYMDQTGKMVIPPMYDYADDFSEGLAVVALHNLPCIINTQNKRVVDTAQYQFIGAFSEGLAAVSDFSKKKFYINTKGEKVITLSDNVYEARKFKNGRACVSKQLDEHVLKFNYDIVRLGYRFGYMDTKGNMIIDFIYEDADDFNGGVARVKEKNKFGLINTKGEWVLKPEYENIDNFNEGKAVVDAMGKYGYADTLGKIVIAPQFDMAFDFSEGMAAIWSSTTKKYGFINDKGEIKITPTYDDVRPFSEGKAAVLKEGKWGFIDKSGTLVLRHVFDNATVYREGMCAVLVKKRWGFIDDTGRLAIPADYDAVGSFDNGVADVVYNGISVYVNKQGGILPKLDR